MPFGIPQSMVGPLGIPWPGSKPADVAELSAFQVDTRGFSAFVRAISQVSAPQLWCREFEGWLSKAKFTTKQTRKGSG
jgi:hypothetical protein